MSDTRIDYGVVWCAAAKVFAYLNYDYSLEQLGCHPRYYPLLQTIKNHEYRVIYGLGKVFEGNFFSQHWDEVFRPKYLVDLKEKKEFINLGIPFLTRDEFVNTILATSTVNNQILLITWVKNDHEIVKVFKQYKNLLIINVYRIFSIFSDLNKSVMKLVMKNV